MNPKIHGYQRPPQEVIGPVVAEYGPFLVRQNSYVFEDGRTWQRGEVVLALESNRATASPSPLRIVPLDLHLYRPDLPVVVRTVRLWLNARRKGLAMYQSLLQDMQRQLVQSEPADDQDITAHQTEKQVPSTQEDLYTASPQDELKAFAARVAESESQYRVVEQALLALEAQHPELNLEPIEETITTDPETMERIWRLLEERRLRGKHGAAEDAPGEV